MARRRDAPADAALHPALTLRRLEDHLWAAADLFRNKISNQKDYILALLFFKRASDIYQEEIEAAVAELGDIDNVEDLARDPAFHVLHVPEGHSWTDIRNTDVAMMGQALNNALGVLSRANPKQLAGVFERTDLNNAVALPADDLVRIVDHFNKLGPLTNKRVSTDMLGQAYEWLIAKFAAAAGKGGGDFYTPPEVGRLMAGLLEPGTDDRIYDPTCGSGGLLLQCLARAKSRGVDVRSIFLHGQELNPETWAIARMNMLLHGAGDAAEIKSGDTLRAPAFLDRGRLRTFDIVIANPPFSSKNWGHERFKKSGDPFGRIKHLPPKSHGEVAFLQHMVSSMGKQGRLAVVLPNGVLFRGGAELAVRKKLVDSDLLETIVQLPTDMFYGAGIPACVLVCNRRKATDRCDRILLIDASNGFIRRDTKNVLADDTIGRVIDAHQSSRPDEADVVWVTRSEVEAHDYDLTVARYTGNTDSVPSSTLSVTEAIAAYREARSRREAAEARLETILVSIERTHDC